MTRDIVKRLAIQCGVAGLSIDPINNRKQLEAFAQAVLENYKVGLVPVGYISKDTAKYFGNTSYEFTGVFRYGFHEDSQIPIYVLGVNRIDERLGETK